MKRTILLADDSPTIRRLVTQTFAGANFNIVEVSNGDAALKALDEIQPSLVLTDIYMPGKNGYEVCAHVRSHETLHDTPVVLLVGAFDAFDEEVARKCGATANITKPFEPGALIDLVKSLLPGSDEEDLVSQSEAEAAPQVEAVRLPPPQWIDRPQPSAAKLEKTESQPKPVESAVAVGEIEEDLLGLETLFKQDPEETIAVISEEDIDRIADRVIQRLSSQVIENIAWDIIPDITEKIVREELKRTR